MSHQRRKFIRLALTAILVCWSNHAAAASHRPRLPDGPPLESYRWLYRTTDEAAVRALFEREYSYVARHREDFVPTLCDMTRFNDQVDLRRWRGRNELFDGDRMQMAIRLLARCIFVMGELPGGAAHVTAMYERTLALPADWRVDYYFVQQALRSMAARAPDELAPRLAGGGIIPPTLAALELERRGRSLSRSVFDGIIDRNDRYAVLLLHYLHDDEARLKVLDTRLSDLDRWDYFEKASRSRDVVNVLSTFPAGRRRLADLRAAGRMDYVQLDDTYFVVLPEPGGPTRRDLLRALEALTASARLLRQARRAFSSTERVHVVHVTPDRGGPARVAMNTAGWSADSLYMAVSTLLARSPRAVSFTLLHEACEQQYARGAFSRRLGETYLDAVIDHPEVLDAVRLGSRIGGDAVASPLGHPWHAEREWLAELGSAVIIGEAFEPRHQAVLEPALRAVRDLVEARGGKLP